MNRIDAQEKSFGCSNFCLGQCCGASNCAGGMSCCAFCRHYDYCKNIHACPKVHEHKQSTLVSSG